ncbi:lipocalin family protein [uncultured Gelidibacter sp.]|uniref:lipocalin family protein n=1 Tax=uncultured Gelidibacter sp. TaxID=259318 RepID=UPI002618E081|nr:lipocalin family protein [uncultured Gelidibacter sp.]
MKKLLVYSIFFLVMACGKNPESFIPHLNGYWEIDEVTLPDGSKRDYTYNDTVDYLSVTDSLTGFRKKMKPSFDGTYTTSDDAESLKLKIENDSLNVYYTTPYAQWKETVLNATEDALLIVNEQNVRYLYKRFEPITVEK